MLGGYHHWHSQDDNRTAPGELTDKKGKLPMGSVSYSAHISNDKSAITSKSKLAGVAKHNLRKYKSADYSVDDIKLLYGTTNLYRDVKDVYHREFDEVVKEYNLKQKRPERRIDNYFDHVAKLDQDMAVEIIFQCGDKVFWDENTNKREDMSYVFNGILKKLEESLPDFKIANAVIHFDEASPHMHVVGVPVGYGAKRGLPKKVSKRTVFTPKILSGVLQGELREEAAWYMGYFVNEKLKEKSKGRNYDLSVAEYKVKQEKQHLEDMQELVAEADLDMKASKFVADDLIRTARKKVELIESDTLNKKKELEELDKVIVIKKADIKVYDDKLKSLEKLVESFDKVKAYIASYLPLSPLIEEYCNTVERKSNIEAGNSYRGLLTALGELLQSFKELIIDGICWFPRLMRWHTSKGEVAPVFSDNKNEGYDYRLKAYMNVITKEQYSVESVREEIKAENRVGTLEQLEEKMAKCEMIAKEFQYDSNESKRIK